MDFRMGDGFTGPERTRTLFGCVRSPDALLIGIADPHRLTRHARYGPSRASGRQAPNSLEQPQVQLPEPGESKRCVLMKIFSQ
jgi:hypothetical protein